MTRHEKPQKKNRRFLTVNQHVFPLASIARFANTEGRVSLHDLARSKVRFPKPDHDIFCAKRAWDQRAERGYMKEIEDEFKASPRKLLMASSRRLAKLKRTLSITSTRFGICARDTEPCLARIMHGRLANVA
jgi:hypothetical protein